MATKLGLCALNLVLLLATLTAPSECPSMDRDLDISVRVNSFMQTDACERLFQIKRIWMEENLEVRWKIVLHLRKNLASNREARIRDWSDVHIYNRLVGGRMAFQGHGVLLWQDISLENGRSAWMIENLLEIRLPDFTDDLVGDDLQAAVREANRQIDLESPERKN